MAEFTDREHFIPLRRGELVALLCADKGPGGVNPLTPAELALFRELCARLTFHYHLTFYRHLERLKDAYAPFDPDGDTVTLTPLDEAGRAAAADNLFREFDWLLERANYKKLSRAEIMDAVGVVSDWGVDMDIDLNAFERVEVYIRGEGTGYRTRRRMMNLWRSERSALTTFQRLVVVLRQKRHRRLGPDADTRNIFLKLFKDIPKADLEMVIPGARVRMPRLEQGKLGVSMTAGLGAIMWKLITPILLVAQGAADLGAFGVTAALGLVGYGSKQYFTYQNTKRVYSLKLNQSLYYQNLDNNAGVLHRLLDSAEEQEAREAILAYYYLWRYAGADGWTAEALDDYVELDLERRAKIKIDFEIGDALDKLERLNFLRKDGDRYRALPPADAVNLLNAFPTERGTPA